jgi:hypothetical protein
MVFNLPRLEAAPFFFKSAHIDFGVALRLP